MLHKTKGIVFRLTKYGETSIIVNIFTELFGLRGYIVNGVRGKSAKSKIALYQPLTLVDLVVYHREHAHLERIKEIKCFHPFHSISTDVQKSSIAIFMIEIVNKTVKEESPNAELFEFLFESILMLDSLPEGYENFHLIFLLKLSRYLGFGAHHVNEVVGGRPADSATERVVDKLVKTDYQQHVLLTNQERRSALELLLKFYADHIDNLGEIRSVQVLREVLG